MERKHKWTKDDTIITLYYVLYDLKGLPVSDVNDLAEIIIDSTVPSLQMQAANVRYAMGETTNVLTDFSKLQEEVVNQYRKLSYNELHDIVLRIIDRRTEKIEKLKSDKEDRIKKEREDKNKVELDMIFRKMGKDPKKMRPLSQVEKEELNSKRNG